MHRFAVLLGAFFLTGCSTLFGSRIPQTEGELRSGFAYVPLDPLPVVEWLDYGCGGERVEQPLNGLELVPLLDSLPDNAVRIAILNQSGKGSLSFGESSLGIENQRYLVVLDYVNVETSNITFRLENPVKGSEINGIPTDYKTIRRIDDRELITSPLSLFNRQASPGISQTEESKNVVIPVYVGVGLRLTADVRVLKGKVNLASLGAIAAGVEADRVSGSLVVQTLGVSGAQVTSSLPLPSELNQTTVQGAILAMGSIKAILFDGKTIVTPRVTGMYMTIPGAANNLVQGIISELARSPIPLWRSCRPIATPPATPQAPGAKPS